tara:strand:- start:1985 stop:2119 length:135 start_codon:yes stop_codon:yes gene_type:complete
MISAMGGCGYSDDAGGAFVPLRQQEFPARLRDEEWVLGTREGVN